ncbi:MAG TPA: serine/threonine-protein kinase [Longimicrobium sp.]
MSGILALLLGRRLCDRYRVDSVIATGGMGAVCGAFDLNLERRVAVKVMTAVAPDEDEAGRLKMRFHREATAAARLRHPNVVTVHDFGTDRDLGIDFLVMELLAGEDLAARMRRAGGPLPVEEAVEILREGGMGLAAGHRAGMVHRDVKPANIYLVAEPGGWEVKVLDFGIAQVRQESGSDPYTPLTRFGSPHTPRYASPEQLAGGRALTAASDIYSFALTGLEMLGGEHPGGLNSTGDDKQAARMIKRLLAARPDVPMRLAAVLRRALRLDPATRFPDADAFLDALEQWDKAPPRDAASAAGYASIIPSAPQAAWAAPAGSSPAMADEDATVIAPPHVPEGTVAAPAGPIPQPMPVPAGAPAPPPAAPDAAGDAEPKPRRRLRLRPAGWLLLLLLVAALAAAYALWPAGPARVRPDDGRAPQRPDIGAQVSTGPAGGPAIAADEWERVAGDGAYGSGDALFVVIVASFTPDQLWRAGQIRDAAMERGYGVGLANSAVYPELRDGYVALVAGPYADRESAAEALVDIRGNLAGDAFLKRVTLRRP